MKSDFKELQTRQRLLAEEEKSSKENIEREKKEEREAIQMERERVLLEAKKEHQSAMLEAQKKAKVVEEEKKEWESEKKRIQETKTFEKIVTLNVGGTKYITSLSTLTKYPDSMLGVMFSGRHALPQQEDGSLLFHNKKTVRTSSTEMGTRSATSSHISGTEVSSYQSFHVFLMR
jgi:hypothetical protein